MPLFNSQQQNDHSIRWLGTAATTVVELLVLLALAFAVVRYVEWSSNAAQAEFTSAIKSSASDHSGKFSTPIQPIKKQTTCDQKGEPLQKLDMRLP
jgi:hypothetical protein